MAQHTYTTVYMAVRHSADGYDWTDVRTTSGHPDVVRQHVQRTDGKIPQWAKDNQLVRVARFQIVE
jgi:hypothetical protein